MSVRRGLQMLQRAYERYRALVKELETDNEYLFLMDKLNTLAPSFSDLMNGLDESQQCIITEHLGLCSEISERITEILCFLP